MNSQPFNTNEAGWTNEMMGMNNDYIAIKRQYEQHKVAVENIKKLIHDIQAGTVKEILETRIGNITIPIRDKKQMLNILRDRMKTFENAKKGIEGQLLHREDLFVESMLKVKGFLDARLQGVTIPQKKDASFDEMPSIKK